MSMVYGDIKNFYYSSDELADIPDRWEELPPILSVEEGDTKDIFVYVNTKDNVSSLKKVHIISFANKKIEVLSPEDFVGRYSLGKADFDRIVVKNYEAYFAAKDKYAELYAYVREHVDEIQAKVPELMEAVVGAVGQDMADHLYRPILRELL